MKNKANMPVVRIEINSGTFMIPAGDKIYEITVRQNPSISEALDAIVAHEYSTAGPAAGPVVSQNTIAPDTLPPGEFQRISLYKEISEEMFKEIGRLARDLSISIKDLPSGFQREVDFEKAGLDLESAKSLLEEVVKMTESATMTIMDISEDMQDQCSIIKQALDDVRTLNFVGNAVIGTDTSVRKDPLLLMRGMLLSMRSLRDSLSRLVGEDAASGGTESGPAIDRSEVMHTLADLDVQITFLEHEYNGQLQASDRYMIVNDSYSMVRKEDHDRLIAALEASDHVIQCIINNIGRILESLSFQDLSGQRIIKIVDLLSNVQIQLLSILVSSGVKLKRLREGRGIEKLSAEAEVDALMSRFRDNTSRDGTGKNILDQQAIDSLLADLGF